MSSNNDIVPTIDKMDFVDMLNKRKQDEYEVLILDTRLSGLFDASKISSSINIQRRIVGGLSDFDTMVKMNMLNTNMRGHLDFENRNSFKNVVIIDEQYLVKPHFTNNIYRNLKKELDEESRRIFVFCVNFDTFARDNPEFITSQILKNTKHRKNYGIW